MSYVHFIEGTCKSLIVLPNTRIRNTNLFKALGLYYGRIRNRFVTSLSLSAI